MIAYKLLKQRKDGSLGPLFINRKQRIEKDIWYHAEDHPTKGYAHRPGWHCCEKPEAPHLKKEGRVWAMVDIGDYIPHKRPANQGGLWYTANLMKVLEILT
jgi:hypothetical protein